MRDAAREKADKILESWDWGANYPPSLRDLIGEAIDAYAAEQIEAAANIADEWERAYPTDIFVEPPPGEHGKTVDACSARMARHVAKNIASQIRALLTPS